jgi:hypothetical protein
MVVSVVQTGVVVENIDAAEVGLEAREQLAHLILIGEIGLPCMRADAVLASVDTDHRGTLARQPMDDGPGKALAAPVTTQTLLVSRSRPPGTSTHSFQGRRWATTGRGTQDVDT